MSLKIQGKIQMLVLHMFLLRLPGTYMYGAKINEKQTPCTFPSIILSLDHIDHLDLRALPLFQYLAMITIKGIREL